MRAVEFVGEGWSQKYKRSINCSHPKGFSQRAHCAGKKKHNESVETEMTCPDCGMCEAHGNSTQEEQLDELNFLGSQCTKDCSGHRAGYDWSKRKGNVQAASWSPSFNKGAALRVAGK